MIDSKAIKEMTEALKLAYSGTKPYDTTAEVLRVEDGIAWVHIPGGADETPVQMSINARPGDTVRVRVAGGQAWTVGNDTAPPTDDRTANAAIYRLDKLEAIDIIAKLIKADGINADWINAGSISADKISGGSLALGGDSTNTNGRLDLYDEVGTRIASINFWGFVAYERNDGWYDPINSLSYINNLGIVSNSDRYIGGVQTDQRISSRLYDGNISIYGNGGSTPPPDSPLIPEAYYQETPLFHINVEHIDPEMQGENVTNISSLSDIDVYIGGTDPDVIDPYQWDSHFGNKVLTIGSSGISMEPGKTIDGVDISELASKHTFTGSVNSIQYGVTNDGYPYLRWIYSNGDQYQIVTSATGIAFAKRPSGGSWTTLWTK